MHICHIIAICTGVIWLGSPGVALNYPLAANQQSGSISKHTAVYATHKV